jgi:hypothetical protein
MKSAFLSVVLFLPIVGAYGQQTAVAPQKPRIEVLITKTSVFITSKVEVNGRQLTGQGTGFLVSVPDQRLPKDTAFMYLVTNRHVAQAIESVNGNCQQYKILETSITINRKAATNGKRQYTETFKTPPTPNWVFPADDSVDLAVVPFAPDAKQYDVAYVGLNDFIVPELLGSQFGVGDKILFAGLFAPFEGTDEIQPILRQGMLSMIPDGPIPTTLCKPGNVYLADVHAIAGNSGSPVFMTPRSSLGGWVEINGAVPYALLGVISGYENESENLTLQASTITLHGAVAANSGIAIIVPAYQLKALLESAPLQKLRDEAVAHLKVPEPGGAVHLKPSK